MLATEELLIVQNLLIEDEGLRQFPYLDCCGKDWKQCLCQEKGCLTIGVGRNLDQVGISENEAIGLELNDLRKATVLIERAFPWFLRLGTPRRVVVVSMVFNMGLERFQGFQKMIKGIESADYNAAAREMTNSKWAKEVGTRAIRLAGMMKTGQF